MLMKKIFSLCAVFLAAMTINAAELTLDLNAAQGYASADGSSNASYVEAEETLNVEWTVNTGWEVAGVEFSFEALSEITSISFKIKNSQPDVDFLIYLVDAQGGLLWEDGSQGKCAQTGWTEITITPDAALWGSNPVGPYNKLVMVANPSTPVSGTFALQALKIAHAGEEPVTPKPETAPAAPQHEEADVLAMYCNHYAENNLHFETQGWGDTNWETLNIEGTDVRYTEGLTWEMMTNWDADSYDFSEYAKFHFDVWVPFAAIIKVTFEAMGGWKQGITFNLNEGWNTIDCDPAWWITEEAPYDWKDVKYIAFEGYKLPDETSAEGNPFAFANLYWWNEPAHDYPADPAAPAHAENAVMALFSPAYPNNNVNFEPTSWGTAWENVDGKYFYTTSMGWDAFTNWGADHYDMNAYDMFACDIYVTVDANIKITFEALGAGDGGSGWKNGAVVEGLKANEWNRIEVDLLNAPYDSYEFTDLRYLILEGFTSEGSPLGIANAYFFDSAQGVENLDADKKVVKRIVDGQLIIEKNGVQFNVLGTQL